MSSLLDLVMRMVGFDRVSLFKEMLEEILEERVR
jgi:hypothetical protein